MMKGTIYSKVIVLLAAMVLTTSCLGDFDYEARGWLQVGKPDTDTPAMSRAADDEEIDYLVSVVQNSDIIVSPVRFSAISGQISLAAGDYTLMAESCTQREAESEPTLFGQPRYTGSKPFNIEPGKGTTVNLTCTMANAAFKVVKDASFHYTSFTVSATLNGRTLDFTDDSQMGYFNVGEDGTATLDYTVVATDAEGNEGRGKGSIALKARNLSRLHLKGSQLGSIDLSVTYDDTFTPYVTEIILKEE